VAQLVEAPVVAQPDERHANEQLLCWSGTTDTEHSTTSSSNEEEASDM